MTGKMEEFGVLVSDPPWKFGDRLPGKSRGAEKNYPVMSVDQICAMPLPRMKPDAWLFLWRVSSQVEEAYKVCRAWGFTPKTEIIWIKRTATGKRHFGMGRFLRAEHETAIVAVRGKPQRLVANIRSTFEAATGRHSGKPEAFFDLVEKLAPGPWLEMFARRQRPNWTCFGDQVTG